MLAVFGGALVLMAGYHFFVAAPALRRMGAALETHDALLGGDARAGAVERMQAIETRLASLEASRDRLAAQVSELERVARSEMPRVGFVRYNAFDDVGSDLSFALALLTSEGNGVVLSSIYSREETRTYGKSVENFQTPQDASGEEKAAIAKARVS